jgi:GDP-4-dehydro-6-deoxy-D-mannose reductase
MRVLITGAGGFAGRHLASYCAEQGATVVGLGRTPQAEAALPDVLSDYVEVDLEDAAAAAAAIRAAAPERVFHLAAVASVTSSLTDPGAVLRTNVFSTLNLLEAVTRHAPDASVLVTGSGQEYGAVPVERLPVDEDEPLRPLNPYAVSKASAGLLAGFYADVNGLRVVRTRSFNHTGPGQDEQFVVSSFARQIASAEAAGREEVTIVTGNVDVRRDFSDVRDVVRAYWLALESGPSEVFNVCSENATALVDLLAALSSQTRLKVRQRTDPDLVRQHDVAEIRGSHRRLTEATGWTPAILLEQTLLDMLDWWRMRLGAKAAT